MSIRAAIVFFVYPFIFFMSHYKLIAQEKVPELVGHVIDPITNKGIEGVRVQLLSEPDMRLTDAEGKFYFRSNEGFTIGRGYSFLLYKEGYISTSTTDNIILGRFGVLPNLFLKNDSDRYLWITVVDALDGTFLEDITIQIKEQTVITNERGRAKFDFSGLGNAKLKAFIKGECYQDRMVEVYAKDEKEIPLTYKCQKLKASQEIDLSLAQQTLDRALEMKDGSLQGQVKAIEQLIAAGYKFNNSNLDGVTLSGAQLIKTDFSLASFQLANLQKVNFTGTTLDGADLNFAYLEKAVLDEVKAENTYLQYIQGNESSFKKANLRRSSFFMSRLKNADFSNADLTGACLAYCDLTGANFMGANLTDAWFFGSVLDKAIFDSAIIKNTEVSGAVANTNGFTNEQKQELKRISLSRSQDKLQIYSSTDNELSYDYKYPSFKGYYNGFHQIYPRISGSLDFREDSENRPIGAFRNFKGSTGGSISEYYWFNSTFWRSGGRGRKLKDNLRQHIEFLIENLKLQKTIEGVGAEIKRITNFINQKKFATHKNPLIWNTDAALVFMLANKIKDTVDIDIYRWRGMAKDRCKLDKDSSKLNSWKPFYPKYAHCNFLPEGHDKLYKKWTLQRVKNLRIQKIEVTYRSDLPKLMKFIKKYQSKKAKGRGVLFSTPKNYSSGGISSLFHNSYLPYKKAEYYMTQPASNFSGFFKLPKSKFSYYIEVDSLKLPKAINDNFGYKKSIDFIIQYEFSGTSNVEVSRLLKDVILVKPLVVKIVMNSEILWKGKIYQTDEYLYTPDIYED